MTAQGIEIPHCDEPAMLLLAEDLAMALARGDCIALSGELGAGKTTLARAIIRAIAGDPDLEVPSPTFTLVQPYDLRLPLAHFDLYRLASPDEMDELGLDELLADGAALVEWPERAGDRLPPGHAVIALAGSGDSRSLSITAQADFLARFERSRAVRAFLDRHGQRGIHRRFLQGDASARRYESVGDLILMDAPRRPDGPPIRDGLPYSRIAHLAEDVVPFVAVGHYLSGRGFSAPRIHAADLEAGFLLVEDLGRGTVLDAAGAPDPERYRLAVDCLAALHGAPPPETLPVPDDGSYRLPLYDRRALQIEIELLIDWYLPWRRGGAVPDAERQAYLSHWHRLFDRLETAEKALVLRDYHSPNLIWCPDRRGLARIGIIDFQDALVGPAAYDVASLVQDARVTVPAALADDLLSRYVEARRAQRPDFDADAFAEAYAIMAAQRAAKILGIFVRLDRRDGKPAYLRHLPRIERYVADALAHDVLAPLRSWFSAAGIGPGES